MTSTVERLPREIKDDIYQRLVSGQTQSAVRDELRRLGLVISEPALQRWWWKNRPADEAWKPTKPFADEVPADIPHQDVVEAVQKEFDRLCYVKAKRDLTPEEARYFWTAADALLKIKERKLQAEEKKQDSAELERKALAVLDEITAKYRGDNHGDQEQGTTNS